MVLLLALGAAAAYGASDFAGGLLSRRSHYVLVGLVGQAAAAAGSLLAAFVFSSSVTGSALLWGTAAGIGGSTGTLALYRGLARGRMNVAGPLSAVGAAGIPVVVDLALGRQLTLAAMIGIGLAVPGIWLVSSASGQRGGGGIGEGLLAGLGFAVLFVCMDQAGGGGLWPVAASQVTSLLLVGSVAVVTVLRGVGTGRPPWTAIWPGVLGVCATILYLLATREGSLAVAAVLTSLYPAFTVGLAAIVLRERTNLAHGIGLALCAASVGAFVLG